MNLVEPSLFVHGREKKCQLNQSNLVQELLATWTTLS